MQGVQAGLQITARLRVVATNHQHQIRVCIPKWGMADPQLSLSDKGALKWAQSGQDPFLLVHVRAAVEKGAPG